MNREENESYKYVKNLQEKILLALACDEPVSKTFLLEIHKALDIWTDES